MLENLASDCQNVEATLFPRSQIIIIPLKLVICKH